MISKDGFEQRIARNMGIDPIPDGLTKKQIRGLFSKEAAEEAKTSPLFQQALDSLIKQKVLIQKGERYIMNVIEGEFIE
jgi:hypothetical protein